MTDRKYIVFFHDLSFKVVEKSNKCVGLQPFKNFSEFNIIWIGEVNRDFDPIGVVEVADVCTFEDGYGDAILFKILRDRENLNRVDDAFFTKARASCLFGE